MLQGDNVICIEVLGKAEPVGSKKGFRVGGHVRITDANPRAAGWMNDVRLAASAQYDGPLLMGPIELEVEFEIARPKSHYGKRGLLPSAPAHHLKAPDTTKLLRGTEDALKGIIWRDDSQVVRQTASKRYTDGAARTTIKIREAG